MKRAIFPISGDCMSSPDAPITIKDGQKVFCSKYEGSIYNIDALSGKVCIILCDDGHKGVCKEVWGIDEILDVLRLKYYVPEQTIVSIKIDRIKEIYIVEGVIMENKTQSKPAEEVKTCKIIGLEPIFMVKKLGKIKDKRAAFKLIDETFRKQLGAKDSNKWIVSSGLFEKEGITLKEFINTTDPKKLFPHLVDECKIIADEQLTSSVERDRAKRYLDVFIELSMEQQAKDRKATDIQGITPEPQQKTLKDLLPECLKTDEAVKRLQRAINIGVIEETATGLKWLQIGKKGSSAQLAYFCGKLCGYEYSVYGNTGGRVCYKDLEKLFGVTRIDRALKQTYEVKNPQWWRGNIDAIFE